MKRFVTSVVLVGVMAGVGPLTTAARAEDGAYSPRTNRFQLDRDRATRVKRTGIALAVIGTSLAIAGAAVFAVARNDNNDWGDRHKAGVALGVMGAVGLTAGIPMWAIGASEQRRNGVMRVAFGPTGAIGSF